jgi:transcription termination/antitermination protein NusG
VSTVSHFTEYQLVAPLPAATAHWYAVRTRSRHERVVIAQLREQGVSTFLPVITRLQRWSDRRKLVEFPLFPGYVFIHSAISSKIRSVVLFARGVAGFVAMRGEPIPIPDEQIRGVQELLAKNVSCAAYPFLKVGQRVRIRGGSLDGIEGILVARNGNHTLVISVEPIQRSLAVCVDGYHFQVV